MIHHLIERLDKLRDLLNEGSPRVSTDDAPPIEILRVLRLCALHWDPEARLVGNVRARDVARACDAAITVMEGKEPTIDQFRQDLKAMDTTESGLASSGVLGEQLAENQELKRRRMIYDEPKPPQPRRTSKSKR